MQVENINNRYMYLMKEHEKFVRENLPLVVGSNGDKVPFNENRIKKSILKETSASEKVANKVTKDVFKKAFDSNYDQITAPYIREQVCCALQNINRIYRSEYTRLGIPYYDFKEKFGELFKEFKTWDDLTPENIMEKVIAVMNPKAIIELFILMGKDYIGVRNDIGMFKAEGKPQTDTM